MSNIADRIGQTIETNRHVFASADMTAIYSFIFAAIIGVIIALIGAYLAWWYGKKSFDLTTQSFETTIKQIEASIASARDNTKLAVDSAKESLIEQEKLKRKELIFQSRQVWLNDLRDTSVLYLKHLDDIFNLHLEVSYKYTDKITDKEGKYILDQFMEKLGNASRTSNKIEFLFNPNGSDEKAIIEIINEIRDLLIEHFLSCLKGEGVSLKETLKTPYDNFKDRMRRLLKHEWEKTKALE